MAAAAARRVQTAGRPDGPGQKAANWGRKSRAGATSANQNHTGERSRRKREGRSCKTFTPAVPTDKPPVSRLPVHLGHEQRYQLSNGRPQGLFDALVQNFCRFSKGVVKGLRRLRHSVAR